MWQSNLTRDQLSYRASFLSKIRNYFQNENVLEVDTPALSPTGTVDPHVESFCTTSMCGESYFLHTSPEFYMKRMLASGSGSIFQLAKVFRNEPGGRLHAPEFLMLEWYRVGWEYQALMGDIDRLLQHLDMATRPLPRLTYAELWQKYLQLDVFNVSVEAIKDCVLASGMQLSESLLNEQNIVAWRQLAFTQLIEPKLPATGCFVCDYPADEASLAKIRSTTEGAIAERFELYMQGVELANGFSELTDPVEQQQRFEREVLARKAAGLPEIPFDDLLIAALKAGLPACAGVAVGVDRLMMVASGQHALAKVLPFHDA